MSRLFRVLMIVALLAAVLPTLPVAAGAPLLPVSNTLPPPLDQCPNGVQASGALYFICVPPQWNGDLVIFAHGYVAPQEPLTKFAEQLILADGTTIPELVLSQGYAFATTSYRKNGLAVKEGLADLVDLVDVFKAVAGQTPQRVYLIGASEGGLITTLAAEKYPQTFSGGLALCGPIGDFRGQLNYWGDFRVLYDYFFPAARYPAIQIPDGPVNINEAVVWPNWDAISQGIAVAVMTDASATRQLLATSRAPIDPVDPSTAVSTTVGILSYNVFATNEGQQELGGQPFDNKFKWYTGSDNDWKLNGSNGVQRIKAQLPLSALLDIRSNYQTTGKLKMPLITMHTTGDPIVPYWHEPLYNAKTLLSGTPLKHLNIPIVRYGHCSFKSSEALAAFAILVYKVTGQAPADVNAALPTSELRQDFADLVRQYQPELPLDPR